MISLNYKQSFIRLICCCYDKNKYVSSSLQVWYDSGHVFDFDVYAVTDCYSCYHSNLGDEKEAGWVSHKSINGHNIYL